jgi:6-pyruvoyltetrahydropterin/6-carboxytetrahydropterin synthase
VINEKYHPENMARIRITREFTFEMAHALWNYDGPCRNIHGHSYKLFVTVRGKILQDSSSAKFGMVIDFSELKKIVEENIIDHFDHSVIIGSEAGKPELQNIREMFDRFYIVDYQPTCENLVIHIVQILKEKLPDRIELFSIKLCETAGSFAEWYASDNQ